MKQLNLKAMALTLLTAMLALAEWLEWGGIIQWSLIASIGAFALLMLPKATPEESRPAVPEYEEWQRLLQELECTLRQEVEQLNQEHARLESLIKEAVQNLGRNFTLLSELSSRQLQLVRDAKPSAMREDDWTAELMAIGDAVANTHEEGMRSLQFEDICTQVLQSIHQDTHTLVQLADALQHLQSVPDCTSDTLDRVHEICLELRACSHSQQHRRAVSQQSLTEGDVELF